MVPANSCRIPRVPHYSGVKLEVENFHIRDYHALWCAFPYTFVNLLLPLCLIPRPRQDKSYRFRLFRVRSPLLAESLLFSFPSGTEMVHFPEFALTTLCIQVVVIGFPHSEIDGSLNECFLPSLIAAFHVLHRLEVPRHPPFALSSLTIKFTHEQILCLSLLTFILIATCIIKIIYLFSCQISLKILIKKQNSYFNLQVTYKNSAKVVGGDDRSRTCDFLNANQALCQLSYIPNKFGCGGRIWTYDLWVMSPTSYQTAPPRDILFKWWTWVDSNYRPHAYQACALTNWATGPHLVTNYKVKNKFFQLIVTLNSFGN